jgi:hypothetical protein
MGAGEFTAAIDCSVIGGVPAFERGACPDGPLDQPSACEALAETR